MNTETGKTWQMQGYKNEQGGDATGWLPFED